MLVKFASTQSSDIFKHFYVRV